MTETEDETKGTARPLPEKEGLWDLAEEVIRFTLIALLFIVPIRIYIAQPYIVSGASMHPTFESGEYLIIDQLSYRFEEPSRGEVVVFRFPQDPGKFFIKRVIGLPGETVISGATGLSIITQSGGTEALDEPYVAAGTYADFSVTLKEDEYFVMGDNRPASLDSRIFGPVARHYIVGRTLVRLLPPTRLGVFPGFYDYSGTFAGK